MKMCQLVFGNKLKEEQFLQNRSEQNSLQTTVGFCQSATIRMLFTYSWLSNILNPGITIKAKANRHFIKTSLFLPFTYSEWKEGDVEKGRKIHKQFCIIVRGRKNTQLWNRITPFLPCSLHLSRPTIPLTVNGPFFFGSTHTHTHSCMYIHTLTHTHTSRFLTLSLTTNVFQPQTSRFFKHTETNICLY